MTTNFNPVQGATTPKPFNNLGFDPSAAPQVPPAPVPVAEPVVKVDEFAPASTPTVGEEVVADKEAGKGPIRAIKDFVRAAKKLGITLSEYTKGTFKGVIEGAVVGASVYTAGSLYKGIKNLAKKPSKMPVKALAIASGIATLAANYWKTSLNTNEKKADVDHRWTTTKVIDKK